LDLVAALTVALNTAEVEPADVEAVKQVVFLRYFLVNWSKTEASYLLSRR